MIHALQQAVDDSKTERQRQTGLQERAMFLCTEVGEVQKEVLKWLGLYGQQAVAGAKARIAKELCDVIWNACDLANMLAIDLDQPMRDLLAENKVRVWDESPGL